MALYDNIKYYSGVITGNNGQVTAGTLAYNFIASNVEDRSHQIVSDQPTLPRRPFGGDVEIESQLPNGSAIMVVEFAGKRSLILIDQEKYATTECQ